jgi:hypothetical protein
LLQQTKDEVAGERIALRSRLRLYADADQAELSRLPKRQ